MNTFIKSVLAILLMVPATVCANNNKTVGYALLWGQGENAEILSNLMVDSISYKISNESKWEVKLWNNRETRDIDINESVHVLNIDPNIINQYEYEDGTTIWITPIGYFIEEQTSAVSVMEKRISYISYDEKLSGDIVFGDDYYNLVGGFQLAQSLRQEDDSWKTEVSDADNEYSENQSFVIPKQESLHFTGDPLREHLEYVVGTMEVPANEFQELRTLISQFKLLLEVTQVEKMPPSAQLKASLNNKRKKKSNSYSLYVQTSIAHNIEDLRAILYGGIRCATYRFNESGDYGFYIAESAEALEEENIDLNSVYVITCDNQKHLKLDFSGVGCFGAPNKTLYYRAFYRLNDSKSDISLKFPSKRFNNITFGKIRSIKNGIYKFPTTISIIYNEKKRDKCTYCGNASGPCLSYTDQIKLEYGPNSYDSGSAEIVSEQASMCVYIYQCPSHSLATKHTHELYDTRAEWKGDLYKADVLNISFFYKSKPTYDSILENIEYGISGICDANCDQERSIKYSLAGKIEDGRWIYEVLGGDPEYDEYKVVVTK